MRLRYVLSLSILSLVSVLKPPCPAAAQDIVSVYYRNFVDYEDGTPATETAAEASFTAYLNADPDTILIENAPRLQAGADANISGGTFGVELGLFPGLAPGDTVHIRYVSRARGQQGILSEVVPAIPWARFPKRLTLSSVDAPARPRDVTVDVAPDENTLTWTADPGLTYSVYRRTLQDTLTNGASRNLYVRVASGLTEGVLHDTDVDEGLDYGYIVYAHDVSGAVSAHSEEALEGQSVAGLAGRPGATNIHLTWEPFIPAVGKFDGYNIYRRLPGKGFEGPLAYSGRDTFYTDTRLEPGTAYEYQVRARVEELQEVGFSDIVTVTTGTNVSDYHRFASLKTAVVVYQNTNFGSITDEQVERFERMLELARLFYWRNSGMKLSLEFTYYPIKERKDFPSKEGVTNYSAADLDRLGVVNTQYDLVFVISPATEGYWSWGVTQLALPGPAWQTGFSQTQYPYGTGVEYPGHEPGLDYGLTWIFVHEAGHAIDRIYHESGRPEMAHGDQPWLFDVPSGEHFDFQAKLFRAFDAYEELDPRWGDIYEAVDADGDGFPDDDPRVPLDEVRFGSRPDAVDSDDDGLSDLQEAIAGSFSGSDPLAADTDGDGTPDGLDDHPRYPVNTVIPELSPTIDGFIDDDWPVANDTVSYTQVGFAPKLHLAYDADSLYVGLDLPNIGIPELWFDFGADGLWHGRGNTAMRIGLSDATFSMLRTRDGSPEARAFSESGAGLWDDEGGYAQEFGGRIFTPAMIHLEVEITWPRVQVEMAIPRREIAGLTLERGDSLGLLVRYHKVNNQPNQWATTFDLYEFVTFYLGDKSVSQERPPALLDASTLGDVYPNPAAGEVHINASLDRPADLEMHLYDVTGRRVRVLDAGRLGAGKHTLEWDGRTDTGVEAASGVYIVRMIVDGRPAGASKLVRFNP